MNAMLKDQLDHLLLLSLENVITEDQILELHRLTAQDFEFALYCIDYLNVASCLRKSDGRLNDVLSSESFEDIGAKGILAEAIEHDEKIRSEKAAEEASRQAAVRKSKVEKAAAEAFKEFQKEERRRQEKLAYKRYKARQRKLIFGITSLAASLIFVVSAWIIHNKSLPSVISSSAPTIVAQLTDEIGAIWDQTMQIPDDDGQMRQSTYRLNAGYVSILFHGGVKITVEAPAEWSLLGGGNMELFRGRIYAVVPEEAHGFTVMAGNSKVVDLGTEFGVEVDDKNNTQLHVTKGKTLLFSGFKTGKKSSIKVNEGAAKKVSSDGFVQDIDVASKHFVRDINAPHTTLYVLNGSFETLALNHEVWVHTENITLWSTPPWSTQWKPVGTNIWTLDQSPNGGAVTPNAAYGYGGIAAAGKNLGYIRTDLKSDHCLYQELALSLQALRTYDLSVKVGNPSPYNDGAATAYRVELLAGGVVIASDSGASPADDLTWITAGVSYTSGPDKAADSNVGKPLAIRLIAEAFTEKKHLNFDDVQMLVKIGTGND